jgi:hypothetical protein
VTRFPGTALAFSLLIHFFLPPLASAQVFEAVGGRALGMGGAFVAVANDSSATWWNPAGLAAGPFFEVSLGGAAADIDDSLPGRRERSLGFALTTPPFGFSYYRLRTTDIGQFRTIATEVGGREDRRAVVPSGSLSANQFGATLVHTVVSGVHVGTTMKYVRVNGSHGEVAGPEIATVSEWLDLAGDVGGGEVQNAFDVDVGLLAVRGPIRVGGVVRNLREAEVGTAKIPRQARVGFAFDATEVSTRALLVAVDTDVRAYQTPFGQRRVIAVGAEGWGLGRRVGIRGGARFNTTGAEEQAYTAGGSIAVRSGMFVDGYLVYGGTDDESGWGIAARVSF